MTPNKQLLILLTLSIKVAFQGFAQTCPTPVQISSQSFTIDGHCELTDANINQGNLSVGISTLTIPANDTLVINGNFNIYDNVHINGVLIVTADMNVGSGGTATSNVVIGEHGSLIVWGNYINGGNGLLPIPTGRANTSVAGFMQVDGTYSNNSKGNTSVSETGTMQSGSFEYPGGSVSIFESTAEDCVDGCCGFGCTTLPVVLFSLAAKELNGNAHLLWTTTSESNNKHFEILKKSTKWTDFQHIGTLDGMGTSLLTNNYEFIDYDFTEDCYYQIKQIDVDGTTYFFNLMSLQKTLTELFIDVFPNPAPGNISLMGDGFSGFTIHDIFGKMICQESDKSGKEAEAIINDKLTDKKGLFVVTFTNANHKVVKKIRKT